VNEIAGFPMSLQYDVLQTMGARLADPNSCKGFIETSDSSAHRSLVPMSVVRMLHAEHLSHFFTMVIAVAKHHFACFCPFKIEVHVMVPGVADASRVAEWIFVTFEQVAMRSDLAAGVPGSPVQESRVLVSG
jgi:hypothetical protein